MPVGVFDSELLRHLWSTEEGREIFGERNRIQKWYDYEAELAASQAELGIIPLEAAREIAKKADVRNVNIGAIAAECRRTRHPLVPAIRALQMVCDENYGEFIHFGPTTQDVIDTGMVLQLKQVHSILLRDLRKVGRFTADLARQHRLTPMVGRSHGVHAQPITFGHKCAIWLSEFGRNHTRLREAEKRVFVGSLNGAVGTKAAMGEHAFQIERIMLTKLGLGVPEISWQPSRDRLVEYVGILGLIGGCLAKIANEIFNLSHTEIAELSEPFTEGKVGSSTMPHKRNPSAVENIVTVGRVLKHTVGLMQESLIQEHERDGANWKIEWKTLPEACLMTMAMLEQMKFVLSGLEVHTEKMRSNLDLQSGFLMSERVMFALAAKLGKQTAHELVYEASMKGLQEGLDFEVALKSLPAIETALSTDELDKVLDPTTYLGFAPEIVDNVLENEKAASWIYEE